MSLINNHISTLYKKYSVLFEALLTLDEWMFFATNQSFFDNPDMRTVFKRYALIVSTCKENMSIQYCAPVCREFNLNKFSFLWDGESEPLNTYIKNYNKYWEANKNEI